MISTLKSLYGFSEKFIISIRNPFWTELSWKSALKFQIRFVGSSRWSKMLIDCVELTIKIRIQTKIIRFEIFYDFSLFIM